VILDPFHLGHANPSPTIDGCQLQEPGPTVLSKGCRSTSHPKAHRMGLVAQEGGHDQVRLNRHHYPLSHYLSASRSSTLLPHPPPTAGDSRTMTVMALTWVWITVMFLSRSISTWTHPRRKRRTLSNLFQWSRRHAKSMCQVVHQQQGVRGGGNVVVGVVVDPTELSMPRVLEWRRRVAAMVAMMGVLEEVARKILQKPE